MRESADQKGGAALVARHPGSGGGTLVRELVLYACARRDLVAFAGPDPTGAPIPYAAARPFVACLLGLPPVASPVDPSAEATRLGLGEEGVVGLQEIFARDGAEDLAGPARVRVAGQAVRAIVARQTEHRRLLAVAEQLGRCDPLSRRLFQRLAEPPIPAGVFLLGLSSPDFDAAWPGATRIDLTRGEPIDASMADLVSERLRALDTEALALLQTAAILGEATFDDLAAVGGRAPRDRDVATLAARGLVVDAPKGVRFTHPYVADLVVASLPATTRAELHGRAAARAKDLGRPLALAAHHAARSEPGFVSLLLLDRGGSDALRRGDHETAISFFGRGLEMARSGAAFPAATFDPGFAMVHFSKRLGRALLAAGNRAVARRVLASALEVGGGRIDSRPEIEALLEEVGGGAEGTGRPTPTPTPLARVKLGSPPKGVPI